MADPAKGVRRVLVVDEDDRCSKVISDAPTPDVRTDPARPGFASPTARPSRAGAGRREAGEPFIRG